MCAVVKKFSAKEVRRKRGECYSSSFIRVLNNFHFQFAGGYYRELIERSNSWNEIESTSSENKTRSDLRLSQTYREFYAEFDRVLAELGSSFTDTPKIASTVQNRGDNWKANEEKVFKPAWKKLLPVYIALRSHGYSQGDLVT